MTREEHDRVCRELTDRGLIIEAGFVGLRFASIPLDAPPLQIEEMRNAFFAGAQHLFASIMSILEPGEEPTPADLQRLTNISRELDDFINKYKAKRTHAKGEA